MAPPWQRLLGPLGFPEDLQPIANCAHDVLVFHNGLVHRRTAQPVPWLYRDAEPRRLVCGDDGWGW